MADKMTDKKIPTPDEIQKEFEEFVRKRFGGAVQVFSHVGPQPPQAQEPAKASSKAEEPAENATDDPQAALKELEFNFKPKDIKRHLDRFVIRQDEAKKALAIAVCDHYNHVFRVRDSDGRDDDYAKQNVLILGPTGVGKTYLIKHIARLIGVPFVRADATRFTEAGYVGASVDDLVRDLVSQADNNIELAQYGIIYLDEADKLASQGIQGRDVGGRGVQTGLLKLMEETEVDLSSGNDMRSQMQAFMEFQQKGKVTPKIVNTRNILFIVSGAFPGLEEIVRKRLRQSDIGFAASRERMDASDSVLGQAATEDFVEFGFEPEFIGRLPIRVACEDLEVGDLFEILKNSEGSLIRQYRQAFAAYGIDADFADEALRRIAERAADQKTGARALMSVCESALRSFKFELPSTSIDKLTVTAALIDDPETELKKVLEGAGQAAQTALLREIKTFEEEFYATHGMKIAFDDQAAEKIISLTGKRNRSVAELCRETLFSYEHGLKLVQQNTGKDRFVLGPEVVENPQGALEKMIRESYSAVNAPSDTSRLDT